MIDPWERQQAEPAMWYGRFEAYRIQGTERSVLETVNRWRDQRGVGRNNGVPQAWWSNGKKWKWQERAEAWDDHERRRRIQIEAEERDAMYRRHAQLGLALQVAGGRTIRNFAKEDAEDLLSPGEARLSIKDGVDIERTARGLPREFVEIIGMSDDELLSWYRQRYSDEDIGGGGDETAGAGGPADNA